MTSKGRSKMEFESETVVICEDTLDRRRSFWGRVLIFFGKTILVALASAPLALAIALGVHGLETGEISSRKAIYPLRGDAAISFSWLLIGIGCVGFGWILEALTGRPWTKWLLWIPGGGMWVAAGYFMVKAIAHLT